MPTPNAGFHQYNTGDILTASQVQYNLQNQTIMYFADAAARDLALGALVSEGMFAYLADTNTTVFYDGTTWQSFGTGDVTGLTAGAGITITNASGPVPTIAISSNPTLTSPKEVNTITAGPATGTVNIDVSTSAVLIYTSNATANFTLNVRGNSSTTLDSLMSVGQQISVVFESPNGATPYYATSYTIDGTAVTPKWLGGTAPTGGNASATDVYVITIRKTGAATFTCLASLNKYA